MPFQLPYQANRCAPHRFCVSPVRSPHSLPKNRKFVARQQQKGGAPCLDARTRRARGETEKGRLFRSRGLGSRSAAHRDQARNAQGRIDGDKTENDDFDDAHDCFSRSLLFRPVPAAMGLRICASSICRCVSGHSFRPLSKTLLILCVFFHFRPGCGEPLPPRARRTSASMALRSAIHRNETGQAKGCVDADETQNDDFDDAHDCLSCSHPPVSPRPPMIEG